jgi:hypothetical protein
MGRTSIRQTDAREQRFDDLQAATGAGSRTRTIKMGAEHYLADLRAKQKVMNRLADGERLTPREVAAVLSTSERPVAFDATTDVGPNN